MQLVVKGETTQVGWPGDRISGRDKRVLGRWSVSEEGALDKKGPNLFIGEIEKHGGLGIKYVIKSLTNHLFNVKNLKELFLGFQKMTYVTFILSIHLTIVLEPLNFRGIGKLQGNQKASLDKI
jgi:hypothetical protein